jgi:hypothetical protein
MKHDIFRQGLKNPQISNCMKLLLVRTELFHTDGLTHRQKNLTKLFLFFFCYNFLIAPKNVLLTTNYMFTCTMYLYYVLVLCTCTMYLYYVLVLCTMYLKGKTGLRGLEGSRSLRIPNF